MAFSGLWHAWSSRFVTSTGEQAGVAEVATAVVLEVEHDGFKCIPSTVGESSYDGTRTQIRATCKLMEAGELRAHLCELTQLVAIVF